MYILSILLLCSRVNTENTLIYIQKKERIKVYYRETYAHARDQSCFGVRESERGHEMSRFHSCLTTPPNGLLERLCADNSLSEEA